ncbi:hypothetical protein FACS18949_13750 [Clostridia bacterium]|nr:hypothetical protein FACS18949_13750 [Clostridia bacterium]
MSGYAACIRPYIDGEMPDLPVDPSLPQPEPVPAPQPNPIFELVPDDYKVPGFLVADLEAASIEDLMKSYIDGNLTPDAYINLMSEELEPKKFIFDVKSYSVDGSSTWVRKPPITPSSNKISNLLNKESELVLADGYFDLSRDPSTRYVIFPKIEARPKYNKLVVNYLAEHTFSNVLFFGVTTPNRWTPTEKSNNIRIYDGVMVKIPSNTTDPNFPNFIADSNKWYYMPNLGFDVKTLTSTGKTIKDKYTYASLPIAEIEVDDYLYVPSSKWEKFTVSGEQKAPRYKINYKTETHKLKKGDIYSIDGGTTYVGPITETKGITLSVSQVIDSGGSIQIRKIPTTKKSASAVQVINPASRKLLNNVTLTPIKGKIASTNLKNYEIKNPATGKWGKLPKVTGNMEFEIRLKSTAKVAKTITTGNAASSSGKLVVTYGEYSNGKFGITAAEIIP